MPATQKTFIVERGPNGTDKVEIKAERGQQDSATSRVTFFNGEEAVASFINIAAWYVKA